MSSTLVKRIVSAVILAPCFLFTIVYGGWFLAIWLFISFLISLYEWLGLSKRLEYFIPIMFLGTVYMAISYSSFLALREIYSLNILLIFLGMIWFSDIGAYFVGKTFGGPKLIEQVSPNKTWSGFGGALISPAIFALLWVTLLGTDTFLDQTPWFFLYPIVFALGIILGAVGQAGDLLVSFIKRQANVKDTGHIIPGHGGLLDRIDSMLLGAPVFLIIITLLSYIL
ncbi:MAG: phosphatidate cytidylyltransferase [Alphaproteobacteria bacterium]